MKKLILDISQKEKNRILEMYGIVLSEGDNCGPLKEPEKSKCLMVQGININNGKSVYNWCSTNLQWFVQNEKGSALLTTDFNNKIGELVNLYGGDKGKLFDGYKINWDNLLHVCNTGCRYESNPPSSSCNVFKKPELQGPKECPAKKEEMTEFINWVDQLVKSKQFNDTWAPFVKAASKDPCGQTAISGWYSLLSQPTEYPPNSKQFHKYLGSYWYATKKENIRIAKEQKKKEDAEKVDKPGRTMTASGAIIDDPEGGDAYLAQKLKFKNELEKLTPEQRIEYTRLRAKEAKDSGGFEVNWDLIVDLISTLCEFIPGLGSAASLGIDVIHGIVNVIQGIDFWNAGDGESSISKLMSGIMGLLTSAIPAAGNMIKMGFSQTIKNIILVSKTELQYFKSLGNIDYWSRLLWALIKKAGEALGVDEIFAKVAEGLNYVINLFQGYDWIVSPLQTLFNIFNPLVIYAQVPLPQSIKNA